MSRTTVKKYEYEEIMGLEDHDLYLLFQDPEKSPREEDAASPRALELKKFLPEYCKRLKKRGVTKELLYKEYSKMSPGPYSRSQFMYRFKAYQIITNPVTHIEHKAGDKMMVDYADDKPPCLVDKETGEITSPEMFVAILPCSSLT